MSCFTFPHATIRMGIKSYVSSPLKKGHKDYGYIRTVNIAGDVFYETNIRYVFGKEDLLDCIKPLWQELNKLHLDKSPCFKDFYANNTVETRKASLLLTS